MLRKEESSEVPTLLLTLTLTGFMPSIETHIETLKHGRMVEWLEERAVLHITTPSDFVSL